MKKSFVVLLILLVSITGCASQEQPVVQEQIGMSLSGFFREVDITDASVDKDLVLYMSPLDGVMYTEDTTDGTKTYYDLTILKQENVEGYKAPVVTAMAENDYFTFTFDAALHNGVLRLVQKFPDGTSRGSQFRVLTDYP